VDCLINNAGITSFTLAEADSIELVEHIIQTNLLGAIYAIKTVLPEMIGRKDGWIISILSVAAKKVYTRSSAYAASKMGLQGYTDSMREEVRQYGIRVTNVFPGPTATPIWRSEVLEKNAGRMMKAEQVAKLMVEMYKLKNTVVLEELIIRPISGEL
jgi:short-subunit dehydrogenase